MLKNLLSASLIFFVFVLNGSAFSVINLNQNQDVYDFKTNAEILPDSLGMFDIHTILEGRYNAKFLPFSKDLINSHTKTYWMRLNVSNQNHLNPHWVFCFGDTDDEIVLYETNGIEVTGTQLAGLDIPFGSKEIKNGKSDFLKINIAQGSSQQYVIKITNHRKFSSQLFQYNIEAFKLYSEPEYKASFEQIRLLNTFFYGAILMMFFYNLILTFSIQSRGYMAYSVFIGLFFVYNFVVDGLATELFFQNHLKLDRYFRHLIAPVMTISYLVFGRVYLKLDKYLPVFDKIILINILLIILSYVFYLKGYWWIGRNFSLYVTLFACVTLFIASIVMLRKQYLPAIYYFAGNSIVFVCAIAYILYLVMIIPHTPGTKFIEYSIQCASIFELSLFSLGMASRIKTAESEMATAQIHHDNERKALIEQKNIELEEKVKERTEQLLLQREEFILINEQLENKVRERTKKLQKAYRDLLNLNYELDSFIYRAAHDIRGPITTIMGLCNIALMEKDFKKCQEYLLILDKYSKTTQLTLNRILGVNDLKNNHIKLSHLTIHELVESVKALLVINNQDRSKVDISFDYPEEDDLFSDFYLLQLIVQNIVDNSIRFRSTKSDFKPQCKVVIVKETDCLKINIQDNGEGIDASIKDKIFDMFFRGSEYSSGSGLGLYIVKIAVKKLNGTIELTNHKRGQTTFEIKLPYFKEKISRSLANQALQTPVN